MTNLRAALDQDRDSLDVGLTDGYELLDQIQSQLDEAIRLYRDRGYSLSKAADIAGVGVLHLMDEIERRKLRLIGSEELGEASARAIAELFDDPEFLELYQRGKQRLAERRLAEPHARTVELPPLTEVQARALVALIEREERAPVVRERAAAYETGAGPGEITPQDLAALKEILLQALGQDNTVKAG